MLTKVIFATHAAAYAFTAWRLFALGLAPRQPGLLAFLLFRCALAMSSWALPLNSHLYFWAYVILTPLDAPVSSIAVREALGLVLHQYPGIRSLARWTMYGAVAVAVVASAVMTAALWAGEPVRSNLYYVEVTNRSVAFSLAVIVSSLLIFLSHYRLDLSRNRLVSSVLFGCVVLSDAVTLCIDSTSERLNSPVVDLINVAFGSICVLVWGCLLMREQSSEARPPKPPRPGDEGRLRQLRALEQALSRAGRA